MKRISIYFFCAVALGCVTSSILYRTSEKNIDFSKNEIRLEKVSQEENDMSTEEVTVHVSDISNTEERFLIIEEDGYLVIYDRMTMKQYDETTIQVSNLPVDLQQKLQKGLYFVNEEALYAFLENYSS